MDHESLLRAMERAGFIDRGGGRAWPGGGYVWLAYGMRLKELLFSQILARFERMNYQPIQFPSALPGHIIRSVNENIVNLEKGTYWLTDIRNGEPRVTDAFANSTNDAAMSFFLKEASRRKRVRLPVRTYTRHQILRSHTQSTRPFFNSDENTDLVEAYFISANRGEVEREFDAIVSEAGRYFTDIGMAHFSIQQSMWGNKPVADKVTSLQTFASQARGSVRLFSIYLHGSRYSKLVGLRGVSGPGERRTHLQQIGFGFWEGAIVPLLDHFRDQHGFCLPPEISPYHIMVLPRSHEELRLSHQIVEGLGSLRVRIDVEPVERNPDKQVSNKEFIKRLGYHLFSGVPVRVTIVDKENIKISRRDTLKVTSVRTTQFISEAAFILADIQAELALRAKAYWGIHTRSATTLNEVRANAEDGKLSTASHCGNDGCAKALEARVPGEFLGYITGGVPQENCVHCGSAGIKIALIGRRAPTP